MKSRSCPVRPFLRSSPCGDGQSEVTEPCNQNPCLPDPTWSEWGDWSQCSQTCGMFYNNDFIAIGVGFIELHKKLMKINN